MKFSLFQGLTVLACSLAVLTMGVHAKASCNPTSDPSCVAVTSKKLIPCEPGLEMFCSESASQLDAELDAALAELSKKSNFSSRDRSYPAIVKRGLWDDVTDYFKTYWKALGMIVKGDFGEGIFLQLKNSGSWCNKSSWIVKAVKKVIEKLSGGGLTAICECLVPMVDKYDSFSKLKHGVDSEGFSDVLKGCSSNMRDQIKNALKKAGSIFKKTGGK
ncbi:hypothetical protein BGX24_001408 [Mortierella sp. AD032]|nr:hypothetical protein BGX24_001408 [Mortierella sp. AD032]